jgi:hypothetical protein
VVWSGNGGSPTSSQPHGGGTATTPCEKCTPRTWFRAWIWPIGGKPAKWPSHVPVFKYLYETSPIEGVSLLNRVGKYLHAPSQFGMNPPILKSARAWQSFRCRLKKRSCFRTTYGSRPRGDHRRGLSRPRSGHSLATSSTQDRRLRQFHPPRASGPRLGVRMRLSGLSTSIAHFPFNVACLQVPVVVSHVLFICARGW